MANERRLIDADKILKFCEDGLNNPNPTKAFGHDAIEIMAEIQCAPTVDAVEVVRCRDCKHYTNMDVSNGAILDFHWCGKFRNIMVADDFCSRGERR